MSSKFPRRRFIAQSVLASAGLAATAGAAEVPADKPADRLPVIPGSKDTLPTGKIGKLTLSRLVSGGNLISGWAHSRDLHYVPSLMRAYNTEQKVQETLEVLETNGINTIIADPCKKAMDVIARYWKERGGKIQWIAEGHPDLADWKTNIQKSIDFGAAAIYVQGVIGDQWLQQRRLDLLGKVMDFIKGQGVPAGIGAHKLEVIMESEKNGYGAEFYVKTLHDTSYWSTRRPEQTQDVVDNSADNYWDYDPGRTIAYMRNVKKPWIAFKILAAGAIRPEPGFRFALKNGADFICVGMFDYQVEQNVALVKKLLPRYEKRDRGWMA